MVCVCVCFVVNVIGCAARTQARTYAHAHTARTMGSSPTCTLSPCRARYMEKMAARVDAVLARDDAGCPQQWLPGEVEALRHKVRSLRVPVPSIHKVSGQLLCALARMHNPSFPQPALVVEVRLGLGSRLRAVASAMALAQSLSRTLVVVWPLDSHCEARLEDLFDVGDNAVVVGEGSLFFTLAQRRPNAWVHVDMFRKDVRKKNMGPVIPVVWSTEDCDALSIMHKLIAILLHLKKKKANEG